MAVAALTGTAAAAACSSDAAPAVRDGAADTAAAGDGGGRAELAWDDCGSVECTVLAVPLDHDDPGGAQIELTLARRPADGERRGAILVNPGGPGASGLGLVADAETLFRPDVLEHFDVVAWDPRGVGASTPVDCVDDLDAFWALDRTPDAPDEVAAIEEESRRLVDGCIERSGRLLEHVGTRDTVADMDAIRAALGDDEISYVGYSYGTLLGLLYADTYPQRVRAMVLDGAVDPSLDFAELAREQGLGFEHALDGFLAWCEGRCALGPGAPADALDALLARIDGAPLPAGDGRTLGPGETEIGIATALYGGEEAYPILRDALERAVDGDGSGLLRLSDVYTGRAPDGSYDNETEAFYAIGCADGGAPPSVEALRAVADDVGAVAPHLGGPGVWLSLPCVFWPAPTASTVLGPFAAEGAPPIVVVRTTGDPATPAAWGQAVADQLADARLVTLDAAGHVASGRGVACVDDAVADYLLDGTLPPDGLRCAP